VIKDVTTEHEAGEGANDMRRCLEGLNQSMWLSDLSSCVDMVVPLDTPVFGKSTHLSSQGYSDNSVFHKSALYSLVVDNLGHSCFTQGQGSVDLNELIPKIMYNHQPNLATVQMQLPYGFKESETANFLQDLNPESILNDDHYLAFNSDLREPKRPAIRHTFTLRGLDSLLPQAHSTTAGQTWGHQSQAPVSLSHVTSHLE
jgi:hypothetical protein